MPKNTQEYFLIRLFLMWMLLFMIGRIGFLLLLFSAPAHADLSEWPLTFLYGLRLDISTSSYLLLLPTLLWIIILLTSHVWLQRILHYLNYVLLLVTCIILTTNYAVYKAWGTLINARALDFLHDTEGIFASLSTLEIITRTALFSGLYFSFIILYKKLILRNVSEKHSLKKLIPTFITAALLPILLRGGLQEIPINESASCFTETTQLNDAATNPVWFLANNISKRGTGKKNPYKVLDDVQAEVHLLPFSSSSYPTKKILHNKQPNIVLVVLESWTADIIAPLGGDKTTTPFFSALCDSGILFTSIYSSGRRTDQMFPSVLSGFPSLPNFSISRFTDKIRKLPMLSNDLRNAGYSTSFYYGGELGFANMKSYLLQGKFQKIIGKDDFDGSQMNSKWGAHDQFVFDKMVKDLHKEKQPFFSMILTLSSHEPFEVPGQLLSKGKSDPDKFRNAAFYTDRCLSEFISKAAKQTWFKNTLFIFVADHGHLLPLQRDYYDPACYRIPLLWFGPAIADSLKGSRNNIQGGQHEIASTLLGQLSLPNQQYIFSKDLFKQYEKTGIYINYDKGFGWIEGKDQSVYLFTENKYIKNYTYLSNPSDSNSLMNGKVFLQKLYSTFLKL